MTQRLPKIKEALPREAFAIVGNPEDPDTWRLPHHRQSILRALRGRLDIEKTVDWDRMNAAVTALSPLGHPEQRVEASPGQILAAAAHLSDHYRRAGKPLPDILAALA